MVYLFVAVLGLCCCAIFPLVAVGGDVSLAVVPGFVTAVAPLVEHRLQAQGVQQLQHVGSEVVAGLVAPGHVKSSWARAEPLHYQASLPHSFLHPLAAIFLFILLYSRIL